MSSSSEPRLYQVIVVGGSFAGLAAATSLARMLQHVLVVDSGLNRNRSVAHAHNLLGHDNKSPKEILDQSREQFLAYQPYAEFISGTVVSQVLPLDPKDHGGRKRFTVTLADGRTFQARRVILAMGVQDELPNTIAGLWDLWGGGVAHCPHCAGWELREKRLGILHECNFPMAFIYASMVAELNPSEKVYFLNGKTISEPETKQLEALGYRIEPGVVTAVQGNHETRALSHVVLAEQRNVPLDAVFCPPHTRLPELVSELKLTTEPGPMGLTVKVDPGTRETSVPGVYAAGDMSRPMNQLAFAVADGLSAGVFAHMSMVMEV